MKQKLFLLISIASLLLIQACNSSGGGGGGVTPTTNGQSEAAITSLVLALGDSRENISFDGTAEANVNFQYYGDTAPDTIQLTSIAISDEAVATIGDATTDSGDDLSIDIDIDISAANPSVSIVVTAQDGKSSKTYRITITLTMVDSPLKEITDLDVRLLDANNEALANKENIVFNADYTATVSHEFAYGTSESDFPDSFSIANIVISDRADASPDTGSTVSIDNSQDQRTATIRVTAEDESTQDYTLRFIFTIAKNTEASITSLVLTVSGVDYPIEFDDKVDATIDGPSSAEPITRVTVKSISVSADATSDYDSGDTIILIGGKASITVTSQDGSAQAYTIRLLVQEQQLSSEANIINLVLTVSGVDYLIEFDDKGDATVYGPYSADPITRATIKSISVSDGATLDYLEVGVEFDLAVDADENNTATISIRAQNGRYVRIYDVVVLMQPKPIGLEDILFPEVGTVTVPNNLSEYDELTQAVLAPYNANANLIARYITIAGGTTTTQDGTSWSDAAPASKLKQILDDTSGDATSNRIYLILVASGATADASYYYVGEAMQMQNHVAIIGGWDASGGWDRSGITVLSGGGSRRVFNNDYSEDSTLGYTSVLYGLTIVAGRADNGGGMYNKYASPTLTNITFSANSADYGGGMYNDYSSPTLTNITFSANSAVIYGGAMHNNNSSPTLTNITFYDNSAAAGGSGGAMHNNNSSPTLTNIIFSANSAGRYGGAMHNNNNSSPTLTNITFYKNSSDYGGGMYNIQSSFTMTNVTFSDNAATSYGGGIYILNRKASTIVNSIFWGNTAPGTAPNRAQIYIGDADGDITGDKIILAYSVIAEGTPPNGDIITSTNLVTTDPSLSALSTYIGSFVATMAIGGDSSAKDVGIYVRRNGDNFYYSTDNDNWYSDFTSDTATGLTAPTADTVAEHADSIDITATDATGTARSDRPDAGAYEAR